MGTIAIIDPACPKPYSQAALNGDVLGGTEATVLRVSGALAAHHAIDLYQNHRQVISSDAGGHYLPLAAMSSDRLRRHAALIVVNSWKVALKLRKLAPDTPIILWLHIHPGRHNRKMAGLLARAAIQVIGVSRSHAKALAAFFAAASEHRPPVGFIYNPVIAAPGPASPVRDRDRLFFASAPHKGLVEVFAKFAALRHELPALRLEVADPGYLRWRTGPPPQGVRLLGPLSHSELLKRMAGSLCLFYPQTSFVETFGLVIAEANAVGIPALVHRGLGANDEIVSTPDQCIDAGDPAAIRERIDRWRAEPPAVKARRAFGLSAVTQRWLALLAGDAPVVPENRTRPPDRHTVLEEG